MTLATTSRSLPLRLVVAVVVTVVLLMATSGSALAFQCYNANKPVGAGAFDPETEIYPSGQSGNMHVRGAFVTVGPEGQQVDIFVRGGEDHELREEFGVSGLGTLPHQARDNGSETNGIQEVDFGPPPGA